MLGLILGFTGTSTQAVDLYTGEVPVEDQSSRARQHAMREALAQVLVKLTGDPSAPEREAIQGYLASAPQYVQQFQYRTELRPAPEQDEPPTRVLLLSARFDPSTMESILREAELPLWGQQRPTVLVWLVKQEGRERQLVGLDDPVLSSAIERAAHRRGLPVLFPLLDLTDQQALPQREIWGGFTEPVAKASERYGTETFLLSRLSGDEGRWHARWTLYHGGREMPFETGGEAPEEALEAGVDRAATLLGRRFAVPVTERAGSRVLVAISGVRSVTDFDRVLDYLSGLSIVQRVQPEAAKADRLSVDVWLTAGLDRLDQAVGIGQVLAPAEDGPPAVSSGTIPAHHRHYELIR